MNPDSHSLQMGGIDMKRILPAALLLILSFTWLEAGEVGFIEEFALSKDRGDALKKLIPGTEDYYYYHALHYLNTEQYDKALAQLQPWVTRFGETPRYLEIRTRHALHTYSKNPEKSLQHLKNRLGLYFNQQKPNLGEAPNLPTVLDPALISRERLKEYSLNNWPNDLGNFEDNALEWIAGEKLSYERRRTLLQRLTRPDVKNLAQLVAEDLGSPYAQPFGNYNIHRQMTLVQLEELVKLKPELFDQGPMVNIWLSKLHPTDDEDWRRNPGSTRSYLNRLLAYVRKLSPVHNALKSHVLYHRLVLDRSQGTEDRAIFMEYLQLPRQQSYMSKALLESENARRFPANLNANYTPLTLLPIIGNDEPLVRAYLKEYFNANSTVKEFEATINDTYLNQLYAETKIENGLGEPEQWASQLPPEAFRQLKDRIDIDFAPTNPTTFGVNQPVKLDLAIKNVPTLIIKVFEINAVNFYQTQKREIDTDINLDGLVANSEQTLTFNDPPLLRLKRKFEFPQLTKPGIYVIDFIGAGKSSRALIRKGRLHPITSQTNAGHLITVVNEINQPVKDASVWLNGQEYKAEKDGSILVPYSTSPGRHPIVIRQGDFASLDYLMHQPENYSLVAGIHIDRESLLTQHIAGIIIRPSITVNGIPTSIATLQSPKLIITAIDYDGIPTTSEVPNLKLFEDRETIHDFRVPARLKTLTVQLQADVKQLSTNATIRMSSAHSVTLNGIIASDKIEDFHLAKFGKDYVLELLGRTGEPKQDRPIQLSLKHRDFRQAFNATLKTDPAGRVKLGELVDITQITVTGPEGIQHTWNIPTDHHSYRQVIHSVAGELISLPYVENANTITREEFALFEMRGSIIQSDRFDALSINTGSIEIKGLAAGDYDLWLKKYGHHLRIRVVAGKEVNQNVLGAARHLELPAIKPTQVASIDVKPETITIKLKDFTKFSRVHLIATRYVPAFKPYADLGRVRDAELRGMTPSKSDSVYLAGRAIGDEYQYVLDRRNQRKYPGNMLERPSFLLNPWAVRSTETSEQLAKSGDDYGIAGKSEASGAVAAPAPTSAGGVATGDFANLDFLADPTVVISNIIPKADGTIEVKRVDLGDKSMIHLVVIDPIHTTVRSITLPEKQSGFVDLRLKNGLDPKLHFVQQKQITLLPAGQPFIIADATASRFELYDSLPKVYSLYSTLSNDPKLAEFRFILTWPTLKPEEKRLLYSKYASHELNFFLLKKDPEFFKSVIKPFLANKKDKTFLDHWLLEENLAMYRESWKFNRLNTVERALLAQRLPGEPMKTTRHFEDLFRLFPPQADRLVFLFDTAVNGQDLSNEDQGLIRLRMDRAKDIRKGTVELSDLDGVEAKGALGMKPEPKKDGSPKAPMSGNAWGGLSGGGSSANGPASMPQDAKKLKSQMERRSGATREMLGRDAKQEKELMEKQVDPASVDRPSKADRDEKAENFYRNNRAFALPAIRQLYRRLDPTQEWAENNYHHLVIQQQTADLIGVNPFWIDYVKHEGKGPFLSRNLSQPTRNFSEMMFALAVLDLPFTEPKPETKFEGVRLTLTPKNPSILFHEEVKPAGNVTDKVQILVSQNFYRATDRYREENGERFDKFIKDEFLTQTVYGCQLVITNPTSSKQKLNVLTQIPVGSIAVANGKATRSIQLDLEPYRTQTIDYQFYFPKAGKYQHFPVHVSKGEAPVALVAPFIFDVVNKPTKFDKESWDYVAIQGTDEEVFNFLARENINALNLDMIAFRLRNADFFTNLTKLLHDRHVYHPTVWSFGLYHNAVPVAREYLQFADAIINETAGPIVSPLLELNPVIRHQYEHLEYRPLINARIHSLGKQREIVNDRFHAQYHHFMKMLSYHPVLSDDDLIAITYYLLLQDRIEEANQTFARVNPAKLSSTLQLDYCKAYLDLFNDEPKSARAIAMQYANHPVDRWKNRFAAIINYLDEAEGKGVKVADADDQAQRQAELAAKEASFEFTVENKSINLNWQNLDTVRVNYYLMDVELLFSRNPFVQQSGSQFASIRPNRTQDLVLPKGQTKLAVALPADLAKRNVLVEVTAAGKTRSIPYYANAMNLQLTENYGQLKVTEIGSNKPLPKVYVKTYVRLANGEVKFHKDGYTDHRGRFDYTSVSTPEQNAPQRFSILILSDELGALIREAAPPQQ
jgi:transcription termination factor NusB